MKKQISISSLFSALLLLISFGEINSKNISQIWLDHKMLTQKILKPSFINDAPHGLFFTYGNTNGHAYPITLYWQGWVDANQFDYFQVEYTIYLPNGNTIQGDTSNNGYFSNTFPYYYGEYSGGELVCRVRTIHKDKTFSDWSSEYNTTLP